MIINPFHELLELDTKDIATTAGCATLSGSLTSLGIDLIGANVDKNFAMFVVGGISGILCLALLTWLRARRRDG